MNSTKIIAGNEASSLPNWYNHDVWLFSDLGIDGFQADKHISFSFKFINQLWLKLITKDFILKTMFNKSNHTIVQFVSIMRCFSIFLDSVTSKYEIKSIQEINRELIIKYIAFLNKKGVSKTISQIRLLALSNFFTVCHDLGWITLKSKLIYPEDIPKRPNKIPRFIPNTTLKQLNENIHHLDPNVRRMLLVLQETGMRINELLNLPLNCIFPDKDGDYFLKYFQSKMNKDHIIPISRELGSVIKEQQQSVTNEWKQPKFLFQMPQYIQHEDQNIERKKAKNRGTKWCRRYLSRYIDQFSEKHSILDSNGKIWKIQFHSFRHTVATKIINNQVPHHIIQRYLGHESPLMTSRYAHIFDETLKKAFSEFKGKMVNITGTTVTSEQIAHDLSSGTDPADIDARWIKKHIMAQALPNGICALPVISNSCPHANACLTCVNFRTDHRYLNVHKAQLDKTKAIIDQAKTNGWQRQVEMNLTIYANLEKIISTLEVSQ